MAIIIGGDTITGISSGGLQNSCISPSEFGFSGAVVQTVTTQTTTQASYAIVVIPTALNTAYSNPGTEISLLNLTIQPRKSGNKIIMKWKLCGEATDHNMNFVITRNDSVIAGGGLGRWAGLGSNQYDGNYGTTPINDNLLFVDTNSLGVSTTYKVHIRASGASAGTYWFNRSVTNAGADDTETGMSCGVLYEINT